MTTHLFQVSEHVQPCSIWIEALWIIQVLTLDEFKSSPIFRKDSKSVKGMSNESG